MDEMNNELLERDEHGHFLPGQSGNPQGRPACQRN